MNFRCFLPAWRSLSCMVIEDVHQHVIHMRHSSYQSCHQQRMEISHATKLQCQVCNTAFCHTFEHNLNESHMQAAEVARQTAEREAALAAQQSAMQAASQSSIDSDAVPASQLSALAAGPVQKSGGSWVSSKMLAICAPHQYCGALYLLSLLHVCRSAGHQNMCHPSWISKV